MWQLNADDFLGTVPKGSHGHSKKAHEKKSDAGLVALEGIIEQDRWSSANSPAGAFCVGYPQRHLIQLFQKTLNALIQETLQSRRRRRGPKDRPPLNSKMG